MYATPLEYPPIVGEVFVSVMGMFPGVSKNDLSLFIVISQKHYGSAI